MSETKCQHVVPKFHLRHFSNGDVIFTVNIHDGNQFKQNISDACAWNFIYDDDPQSIGSMEKILCKDEKELSIIIDNIVKNNTDVADPVNLIRFVSHLSSRSLNTIESAQWMKNHNAAIDTKEIIKKLYTYQYEILSTEKSSEYDAFILINNSDIDFITADIPFYFQDVRGSEEQDREKIGDDLFNPDYVVYFCPISLKQCIVITRKSEIGKLVKKCIKEQNDDEMIRTINMNLAYYAAEFIYSRDSPIVAYGNSIKLKTNPVNNEYLDNFQTIRKNHKKRNIK